MDSLNFTSEAQARRIVSRERTNFRAAKERGDTATMRASQSIHNAGMRYLRSLDNR